MKSLIIVELLAVIAVLIAGVPVGIKAHAEYEVRQNIDRQEKAWAAEKAILDAQGIK